MSLIPSLPSDAGNRFLPVPIVSHPAGSPVSHMQRAWRAKHLGELCLSPTLLLTWAHTQAPSRAWRWGDFASRVSSQPRRAVTGHELPRGCFRLEGSAPLTLTRSGRLYHLAEDVAMLS